MWTTQNWKEAAARRKMCLRAWWQTGSWCQIYLADDASLRGNLGAYARGTIWIAERLIAESERSNLAEILEHEIYHAKISRLPKHEVLCAGMTLSEAMEEAGEVAPDLYVSGKRAEMMKHYRTKAPLDFGEECLVRMCCDLSAGYDPGLSEELRAVCNWLQGPLVYRLTYAGGLIACLPSVFLPVFHWPAGKPLPFPGLAEGLGFATPEEGQCQGENTYLPPGKKQI